MRLLCLQTNQFRNLASQKLEFSSRFNCIYGENGSGKSSLLEAIYFLSVGRSFRSALASRAIRYETEQFHIFSTILGETTFNIGLEKNKQGKTRIKISNQSSSISDLAKLLPAQVLNPNSYTLLSGSPRVRRQFIDWGVFHVEPSFFLLWQQFQQILKQRNALLQDIRGEADLMKSWDAQFSEIGLKITTLRADYVQALIPLVNELLQDFMPLEGLTLDFYSGWNTEFPLEVILMRHSQRDKALGYTQYGPQRADLLIKLHGHPAHEVLSRGEQKLLACALQLAQGLLLKQRMNKSCIYLLDDLFAELDSQRRDYLVESLKKLQAQVFVTIIDEKPLEQWAKKVDAYWFHVEQGQVSAKFLA